MAENMRPDESELWQIAREHCDRHGHILGREADTNATIPICERCGADVEAEDAARMSAEATEAPVCPECNGEGQAITFHPIDGRDEAWTCPDCGGTGLSGALCIPPPTPCAWPSRSKMV